MGRVNPIDVGMPADSRVDKAGSAVDSGGLHIKLPRTEHVCPRCSRPMTGHGSFAKPMAHAVGHAPCRLEVSAPSFRRKKCGITPSEEIAFASVVSAIITETLEERIAGLLGKRSIAK